jgi:hypothetical protein
MKDEYCFFEGNKSRGYAQRVYPCGVLRVVDILIIFS